jgi:adenylyltransferase/sulfurtransferase
MVRLTLVHNLHHPTCPDMTPSLLLFSSLAIPQFRSIKLRARSSSCPACGLQTGKIEDMDYVQFCGGSAPDWVQQGLVEGDEGHRIYPKVRNE